MSELRALTRLARAGSPDLRETAQDELRTLLATFEEGLEMRDLVAARDAVASQAAGA